MLQLDCEALALEYRHHGVEVAPRPCHFRNAEEQFGLGLRIASHRELHNGWRTLGFDVQHTRMRRVAQEVSDFLLQLTCLHTSHVAISPPPRTDDDQDAQSQK